MLNIGLIGLGKMGYNLALNMRDHHVDVTAFNRSAHKIDKIQKDGVNVAYSLEELIGGLKAPRVLWMMVPAGEAVDGLIQAMLPHLEAGDIVIDGGNSNYKDTLRRGQQLESEGIHYMDVGTSGGTAGARHGACMMVGGPASVYGKLAPVFEALCVEKGVAHMGPTGAGHYVKMVHNGIEYAMMQAIGEGFEILQAGPFDLNNEAVAQVWDNGSIIEGYLMTMAHHALAKDQGLEDIAGKVASSGEGLWTLEEALRLQVPVPTIADALFARYRSWQTDTFSNKLIAALRNEFGGHGVERK